MLASFLGGAKHHLGNLPLEDSTAMSNGKFSFRSSSQVCGLQSSCTSVPLAPAPAARGVCIITP